MRLPEWILSARRRAKPARRGRRGAPRLRAHLRLEQLEDRSTPSVLIPVPNHRDLVFDGARDLLYVTTSAGAVQRYDIQAQQLLTPYNVGVSLNGADITPDGGALYVTENRRGPTQGFVYKVNLADGGVTTLAYDLAPGEGGSWAIAIANNGLGLLSTRLEGSGWVPLRQVDLSTDALSTRTDDTGSGGGGQVRQDTLVQRGPDRSQFLLTESNISNGPLFTNDAGTNSFPARADTAAFLGDALASVNRDGSLTALEFGNGVMRVSDDGTELFLSTPSGVRMIDLPQSTGVASRLDVAGFPSLVSSGTISSFTVTAKDPAGNVATGFTGTVHFSSTDPGALLQQDYTFTPADQGAHTFHAALFSGGTFSITATDGADGLSGSQTNIRVHTGPVSLIPVANRRDLVFDGARGVLYITTTCTAGRTAA
jgi:hypothetical protein